MAAASEHYFVLVGVVMILLACGLAAQAYDERVYRKQNSDDLAQRTRETIKRDNHESHRQAKVWKR